MFELTIFFFIISVPVFYILGAIKFFSELTKRKPAASSHPASPDYHQFLNTMLRDLQNRVNQNPHLTAQEVLSTYRQEALRPTVNPQAGQPILAPSQPATPTPAPTARQPISSVWDNWYTNNSINVILYLGALFILAAASIFIGVQWDTLSVYLKVLILGFVTLTFIASGLVFHRIPKIKQAGVTFTAIGALLIPLTGIAWVNSTSLFAAQTGVAWVIVACLTLFSYIGIYSHLRTTLYLYLSSLASISLALSLVALSNGSLEQYLLVGLLAAFALLLGSILQVKLRLGDHQTQYPQQLTAQITMPIWILYGLYTAITHNQFGSHEAVISLGISTAFYGVCYIAFKQTWQYFCALLLGILTALSWSLTIHLPAIPTLAVFNAIGIGYIALGQWFKRRNAQPELHISIATGMALVMSIFIISRFIATDDFSSFLLIAIAAGAPVIAYHLSRNLRLLYPSLALIGYGITHAIGHFVVESYQDQLLILSYIACFIASYCLVHLRPTQPRIQEVFRISSLVYFVLALLIALSLDQRWLLVITILLGSATMLLAWNRFKAISLLAVMVAGMFASTLALLHALHAPQPAYPFILSIVGIGLYWLSNQIPALNHKSVRSTSVGLMLLIAVYCFGRCLSTIGISTHDPFTIASLFSAYTAIALMATEAYVGRHAHLGYAASAVGLATYMWQLTYLGVNESQIYTASIAIYFLTLSWIQQRQQQFTNQQSLEAIGLFFLIAPTTVQSLVSPSNLYFVLQLAYGIILVAAGISLKNKQYLYAGIASLLLGIIIKSYAVILLLPKWLLIGFLGLLFLALGIYLLAKRREDIHNPPPVTQ